MTRFLLIRHGAHDLLGKVLAGRTPGVHLNSEGKKQSEWLATRLSSVGLNGLFSSPLERTVETASVISERKGIEIKVAEEFNEIDFGAWTNLPFSVLESDSNWVRFNQSRSSTSPPGGEWMLAAQYRALARMEALRAAEPEGCIGIVSHADLIKGVIAHLAGIPLDLFQRLEISPGSLSIVTLSEKSAGIELVNETMPTTAQ